MNFHLIVSISKLFKLFSKVKFPPKIWGAYVPINANREPPIDYLAFET